MFSQIAQFAHSDDVTPSENVFRIHGTSSEDGQPPMKKPKMEQFEDVKDQNTSDSDVSNVVQHLIDVTVSNSEAATSPDDGDDDVTIIYDSRIQPEDVKEQNTSDSDVSNVVQHLIDVTVFNSESATSPDDKDDDDEILPIVDISLSSLFKMLNRRQIRAPKVINFKRSSDDVTNQTSEDVDSGFGTQTSPDDVVNNSEVVNAPDEVAINSEVDSTPEDVHHAAEDMFMDPEDVGSRNPEVDVVNNSEVVNAPEDVTRSENIEVPDDLHMDSDDIHLKTSEVSIAPEVHVSDSEARRALLEELALSDSDDDDFIDTNVSRSQPLVVVTPSMPTSPDSEVVNAPEDVASEDSDSEDSDAPNEDVSGNSDDSEPDDRVMRKLKKRQLCRSDSSDDDDCSDSEGQKIQKKKKTSSSKINQNITRTPTISDALNDISMDLPTYSSPPDVFKIFEDLRLLRHDDDDVMYPTPMAKQRGAVAQYCRYIFRILGARLTEFQIERLLKYKAVRTKLYKGLVQEGLLCGPAHKDSKIEQLPLYAFLMGPKAQKAYIHGLLYGKMYFRDNIHEKIFNASVINDDDVAECIRYRTTSSEFSFGNSSEVVVMNAQLMLKCLDFIKNGRSDWRDLITGAGGRIVLDVMKVATIDDVKDGRFLVCYEEMPPITTILDKNLNCVVINPSDDSLRLILDHQNHPHYQGNMSEAAYGGHLGILNYRCFGPKIEKPSGKIPTSGSLKALFNIATGKTFENLKGNIYAVEGFF